ncbi:MAG: hypothetical protein Q8Q56_01070 [Alphaproteobacteria bacterium]|nr:hypothetical protein [Alphaproteobacteria bacterium]
MTRLYDMNPALIKLVVDKLEEAATTKDGIRKFLEDPKIKRTIAINDGFYDKMCNSYVQLEPIDEETHHQVHEGIAEIIIAGCIHKSSFEATHEFCTGEGKNKQDTVDFKVVGIKNTYLIEIRSTRESERSQEINKIYTLTDLSDKSINKQINSNNICVDPNPYENIRRLQRQILEKCTKKDESITPHKFPTKDKTNGKHIVVCLPFGREFCDEGDLVDVLYRDYSDSRGNQANARGIFHKARTDLASKIFQERIDCVVFINHFWDKFEIYIGYNPKYFKEEDSMEEFEAMLATFFDADKIRRIYPDPIYGLVGAEVIGIKPTDQPLILQDWSLDSNNITIDLEKKIALLIFQKLETNQNDSVPEIKISFSLDVFKNIDLQQKNANSIKHHILGCLSLDLRFLQPINAFINTLYAAPDMWNLMLENNSTHIIFDRYKTLMLISSADKLYEYMYHLDKGIHNDLHLMGDLNNPEGIIIPYLVYLKRINNNAHFTMVE